MAVKERSIWREDSSFHFCSSKIGQLFGAQLSLSGNGLVAKPDALILIPETHVVGNYRQLLYIS